MTISLALPFCGRDSCICVCFKDSLFLVNNMELEFLEDELPIGRMVRDKTAVFNKSDANLLKRYRMPRPLLLELCHELEPVLGAQERDTDLPVSIRLAAALRVYAEGNFQRVSGDLAGISQPSVSRAVAQVSAAIISTKLNMIAFPTTAQDRATTKAKFADKFGFPNVLGAIDGTHVAIKSPTINEHLYVNRHQRHSINVQAVCDANMLFTDVVAKFPGSTHDSYMFASSAIGRKMEQSGGAEGYLLGDSGYPLRPWMITPFDQAAANIPEKAAFNRIHSKTRGVIERSFGILKSRFRLVAVHNSNYMRYATIAWVGDLTPPFFNSF